MACVEATKRRRHHALAVPLPSQGHLNAMMRFCKRLAAQEGFIITFVYIQSTSEQPPHAEHAAVDHHEDKQAAAEDEADHGGIRLDIRRTHIPMPDLSTGAGTTVMESVFAAIHSLGPQIEQLLLVKQDPPITCLISDVFITRPTQSVADKFNLPRIALYPCSQSLLLLSHYIQEEELSLEEVLKVLEARKMLRDNIFKEGLLGLPTIKVRDLIDHPAENRFLYIIGLQAIQETKSKAHAIVVNTSKEIEEDALKVNIGIPIYEIGLLVETLEKETSTSLWKEEEDEACISWLDSQPPSSVLFISFGSLAILSLPQFEEFVAGLLSSQQRFLWVFRSDLVKDAPYTTFPKELLSKSHGKGYATHWAPQVKVLSHPSIHGFLTHCGWNSTIEAVGHGVPMLCFPYTGDQFLNAKFIIEEWKIGLGFEENRESGLIGREEIERVIQTLLQTQEGERLHTNAKYLREACARSYLPEGPSFNNIKSLVQSLT